MAYIGRDVDKISNVEVLDNITFDGSSSYTLQKGGVNFTPSSANNILLSIDGVVQANNFSVSSSTIDFGTAVAGTSTCDFILHYGTGLITTPADGTVTTAKLADSSVTAAKLASGVGGVAGISSSADATAITIDSSENVGIGTTSPGGDFEVKMASNVRLVVDDTLSSGVTLRSIQDSGTHNHMSVSADNIRFLTETGSNTASERMRITNSGGVNVGSEGTAGTAQGLNVHNHGWSTMATFKTGTSTNAQYVQFINSNGVVGSINMSGSSTSYNTSSDYRLKENIVEITDATTRLKQLKPKRFNFIADADTTVDGFIAHEVSSVVPEAISGEKDAMKTEEYEVTPAVLDEDGSIQPQGIDQSKLVPLLVKTIQELEARIQTLEGN